MCLILSLGSKRCFTVCLYEKDMPLNKTWFVHQIMNNPERLRVKIGPRYPLFVVSGE
jgi:hypothetical protein